MFQSKLRKIQIWSIVAVWLLSYFLLPTRQISNTLAKLYTNRAAATRAGVIREAFIHGWKGYAQYAYPHDMLRPLSRTTKDFRAGWGEQAIDILPAAILMSYPDIVRQSIDHIKTVNWDVLGTDYPFVSIFGTTIRYLGALISAYDLLTTSHTHFVTEGLVSDSEVSLLLTQAQLLANSLSPAFDTPTGMFRNQLRFPEHTLTPGSINDITTLSGIVLEWSRLSSLTGNRTYSELARSSFHTLLSQQHKHQAIYPGLLPKYLETNTGEFLESNEIAWSHAGGGLYEMYAKIYVSSPNEVHSPDLLHQWKLAANSTMKYLASHPRFRPEWTFLAGINTSTQEMVYYADHSGMFAAASFLLGGSVTGEQCYVDFGLELLYSYIELYRSTKTGFGPEAWTWIPDWCDPELYHHQDNQDIEQLDNPSGLPICDMLSGSTKRAKFLDKQGWYPSDSSYKLRPEVMESLYYAYRITKDEVFRDISWELFQNLMKHCKTDVAFAELQDINVVPKPGHQANRNDEMHSWILTETLFYAWAIQAEDAPWQVSSNGQSEWVFTTQAHPIRVTTE